MSSDKLQFDRHNMPYHLWASKVHNLPYAKDCYEAVASELATHDANGFKVFTPANAIKNGRAASIIMDAISVFLAAHFTESSAFEMWPTLNTTFDIRTTNVFISELRDLLNTAMASGDNPLEYWDESESKWNLFPHLDLDLKTISPLVRLAGLSE
ncbi:hypothetical protein LPJ66_008688 [Kickxella alabastrina]|uniref:Uncharacterized protein n=1 Tax=Kickxella alabastrina TaxID=61397 RepID=A0ACC1IDJ1_9FUNG|nr:hypothetical protein LPJ66_008688 [Kickxella alabastrina]